MNKIYQIIKLSKRNFSHININFYTQNGELHKVKGKVGDSLLELARKEGLNLEGIINNAK